MLTIINLAGDAIRCKCPALHDSHALHWEPTPTFRQRGVHIWGHLICTLHGWSLKTERNVWIHGFVKSRRREAGSVRRDWLDGYLCSIISPCYPPNDPDIRSSPCARTKQGCIPGRHQASESAYNYIRTFVHGHIIIKVIDARLSEGPFPSPSNASGRYQLSKMKGSCAQLSLE